MKEHLMSDHPAALLDERFSSPGASPTDWAQVLEELQGAGVWWISTVRDDGRPHVTPLIAVWVESALWFTTGAEEQKAVNLRQNQECVLTTGCNRLDEGLDVVVEGRAEQTGDDAVLERVAAAYEEKYGSEWHFDVRDGRFHHEGGSALVFRVAPTKVLAFGKGEPYTQTGWNLQPDGAEEDG
jgi:general stress protein 26